MDLAILGIAALVAAFLVVVIRRGFPWPRAAPKTERHPFAAVELIPGSGSCASAKKLAGRRELVTEAPALPLDRCTRRCRCAYKWYEDRRHVNRRRSDDGIRENFMYTGPEHRLRSDRRKAARA